MHNDDGNMTDPAGGMFVKSDQLPLEYLHMQFAFCSVPCRERFLANPDLYVDKSGVKSVQQMGQEVIKYRRPQLAEPLPPGSDEDPRNTLYAMMGIKNVYFDGNHWEIIYDLIQATADQIERTMTEFGAQLGGESPTCIMWRKPSC